MKDMISWVLCVTHLGFSRKVPEFPAVLVPAEDVYRKVALRSDSLYSPPKLPTGHHLGFTLVHVHEIVPQFKKSV